MQRCCCWLHRSCRSAFSMLACLSQAGAPSVQRSSDLLHFYSLLADGLSTGSTADAVQSEGAEGGQHAQAGHAVFDQRAEQSASWSVATAAERTVAALVQRGWTLTDLDSLPFGTALPLRAALLSCRALPPEGGSY